MTVSAMSREAITPGDAQLEVFVAGYLPCWTIYERPKDYPDGFRARLLVSRDGLVGWTTVTIDAANLQAVREQIPPGLIKVPRSPSDHWTVVESWVLPMGDVILA